MSNAPIARHVDPWGRTIIETKSLYDLIYDGLDATTFLVEDSEVVAEYNRLCKVYGKNKNLLTTPETLDITPEEEHEKRSSNWLISEEIKAIPVREFLLSLCNSQEGTDRVNLEMDLFEERNLIPLLQLMMFLVDHFRTHDVVWGVGRGSSVASYVLFLIGVHKIDPLKYGLSIYDFLK